MTEPRFLLISRFGLGMRSDEFYRRRIRVIELALARSLRAQTDTAFTWVLVSDARAPAWLDVELERLASGVTIEVWRRDPTVSGMNPVDRAAVRAMTGSSPAILSRCDDDDLLHRTYVEQTRRQLAGRSDPCALTFVDGGNLIDGKIYTIRYPWFSAGLAVLADGQAAITPYAINHTRFGDGMRERGFEAREVSTPHPMWLRTVSAGSDSAASRRIRPRWWQRPSRVVLADFGATDASVEELRLVMADSPASPSPQPARRSRLAQKMELSQRIRGLKAASARSDEDDAEIERLTEMFYDL